MPKSVAKIERFEGGLNNHFEERDIPENSFVRADNVMFDKIGRIRPTGFIENLSTELGLTDIQAESEAGYGLFSFSHDFTNPDKSVEVAYNIDFSVNVSASTATSADVYDAGTKKVTGYTLADSGTDGVNLQADGTNEPWYFHSFDADGTPATDEGFSFDNSTNILSCDLSGTPTGYDAYKIYAYQKIGKPGRAYFIRIRFDFDDTNSENRFFIYGDDCRSLSSNWFGNIRRVNFSW